MAYVLVLKTSSDRTMEQLFRELDGKKVDCLIQSSQFARYKEKYPSVHFIDICQEGFYDLSINITKAIVEKEYDQLYVTLSGIKGHNYGNVMELVSKVRFKKAFFYNCNGDKVEIPVPNVIKDKLCRVYIAVVSFWYGLRNK